MSSASDLCTSGSLSRRVSFDGESRATESGDTSGDRRIVCGTYNFDDCVDEYDAALERGIAISGENRSYFARARVEWLLKRLSQHDQRPKRILDFGCGSGAATPFFLQSPHVQSLLGVDVSARSVELAQRAFGGPRARFCLMYEHAPDGSMDLVFSSGVFHHIDVTHRMGALRHISRWLRPGAFFALWENNSWNPFTRYVMNRIPFDRGAILLSPPQARRLVRAAGFEVLEICFLFVFPRALGWLRFLEPRLAGLPLGTQYLVLCRKPPTTVSE